MSWWEFIPGPLLAALTAMALALPLLVAGAVIEARHYCRLVQDGAALSGIRLIASAYVLPGGAVPGMVALGLVGGGVTLAPPPLGRFVLMLRKLTGGRIDLYNRLYDRARREALLRLRRQVAERGGDGAVGVRIDAVRIGNGQASIYAYGTAVRGLPFGEPGAGEPVLPEAAGSPPAPRKWALAILVVSGAAAAAIVGVGETALMWALDEVPWLRQLLSHWLRM